MARRWGRYTACARWRRVCPRQAPQRHSSNAASCFIRHWRWWVGCCGARRCPDVSRGAETPAQPAAANEAVPKQDLTGVEAPDGREGFVEAGKQVSGRAADRTAAACEGKGRVLLPVYLVLTCWRLQEQAKQLDKETRTVANLRERLKRVRRGGCGCRQQRRGGGRLCANAQCMTWCLCRLLPGQPAAPHERQHSDGILHYHRLVSFALEHVEIAEPRLHVPVHLWLGALHIHHLRVPRAVLRDRYRCTQLAVPNTIGGALPPLSLVASVAVCSPECVFHCHSGH